MTVQQLVTFGITASLFGMVFSLGLNGTPDDLVYLLRRPRKLFRSILAMNVVMFALAVVVAVVFPLAADVKIALIALAVSPVPPILPGKQTKAGGTASYAVSLLIVASLLAIVLVPLSIGVVAAVWGAELRMPASRVLSAVAVSVVIPLLLGVAVARFLPAVAGRLVRPVSRLAFTVLLIACVPVIVTSAVAFWSEVGNGVVLFLILFSVVGIAVGHLLGGPESGDRTVLALATGTRHPGVAMAIASLNFPDDKAVLSIMLWHLVIGAIVSVPYVRWRRKVHATSIAGAAIDR